MPEATRDRWAIAACVRNLGDLHSELVIGGGGGRMTKRSRRSVRAARTTSTRSRAAAAAPGPQAVRLATALQALAHGLPNPWDESTDYFHRFVAAMPASTELSPESLRQALGVGARYQIALSPADDRLTRLGDAEDDWGADIAGGFRQLH